MSLVVGVSFRHLDSSKINRLLCHKPCVAPGHVPSVMKFCMLGPPDTSIGCENITGPACTPMFRQRFCTRSTNCKLLWPRKSLPHLDSRRARHLAVATHKRQHHPEVATKTWQAKMCKSRVTGTKNPMCPNVTSRRSLMLFGTRISKVTTAASCACRPACS